MIGENLKTIREERGLTQGQVAAMIGKSAAFISCVENGSVALSPEQITALASALGIEKEWLTSGTGPMTPNDSTRDRRSIGERVYAVRRDRHLSQTEFAALLGVSRNTVSLLERRKISASQALIKAVVEKCEVDEHWLRTGEQQSRAEEIIDWLRGNQSDREKVRSWILNDSSPAHQDRDMSVEEKA